MIELNDVVYDRRARDGTWCRLPYPNHPRGCPNFPKCPASREDFQELAKVYGQWIAVMVEFDLAMYVAARRLKYPTQTERQIRNLIYWQGKVRSALKKKVSLIANRGDIVLDIPEACGVNVFETMAKVGIVIDRNPDIVRKVMLVGKHR